MTSTQTYICNDVSRETFTTLTNRPTKCKCPRARDEFLYISSYDSERESILKTSIGKLCFRITQTCSGISPKNLAAKQIKETAEQKNKQINETQGTTEQLLSNDKSCSFSSIEREREALNHFGNFKNNRTIHTQKHGHGGKCQAF